MPRSSATSVEQNFSRGLITEATAMNYPENSVVDGANVIYTKNGKVIRRYGVDYEQNYSISAYSSMGVMSGAGTPANYYDDCVIAEYEWTTVANDGSVSFLVVQIGDRLRFFTIDPDNNEISNNLKAFSVQLTTYQTASFVGDVGQFVAGKECSFSSGFGKLFVTHPYCNPISITYDPATDTISVAVINVQVRDFERVNDSLAIDQRPNSLSNTHKYNLYNQGWYGSVWDGSTMGNPVTKWDAARSDFPSNSDVWWLYKDASEVFQTGYVDRYTLPNSPAPNGHYVFSAWASTRNTAASTTGVTEYTTGGFRPSVTSFYAGRVWYAGVPVNGFSSKVYFSKIVEADTDFGIAYQANDPTSEDNAELLPTDGGVINIPEVATILRLIPIGASLYIFASNGIWKIGGGQGFFVANDYSVVKVTSSSIASPKSIVIAEGVPFWWDKAGIYSLQADQQGDERAVSISENTIQGLLNEIPEDNVSFVKGTYNNLDKNIHWIYKSTLSTNNFDRYTYDNVLVLNLSGQSFSLQQISSGLPRITGLLATSNSNVDPLVSLPNASVVKFLTIGDIGTAGARGFTVSQYNNPNFLDWSISDPDGGYDYDSYFITGYRIRGELLRKFQSNYVMILMEAEEGGSCFLQGVWDYSDDPFLGRYTISQQVYKPDFNKLYNRRKLRIRGSGFSLQFKFYSERGKPFTLIGWSSFETANNVP